MSQPRQDEDGLLDTFKSHTVELTLLKYATIQKIPRHSLKAASSWDFNADQMAAKLSCAVWARTIGTKTLAYPADWKEAIKERFFPYWALRRWPVRRVIVDLTAYHAYPELEIEHKKPILQVEIIERVPEESVRWHHRETDQ